MTGDAPLAITDAVQAKASRVGADILAEYWQLASRLRRKGWDEAAALGAAPDAIERACRQCAFQLYGTAASELDDIIAELLDGLDRPLTSTARQPSLRVLDGGRAGSGRRDGQA